MSLQGMLHDFRHHVYHMLAGEERDKCFTCELPSLGESSLHKACQLKSSEALRTFLKIYKGPVDLVDPESGATPLVIACKIGNLENVALLVNLGANVNHRCSGLTRPGMRYDNITPIYVAAEAGHVPIVEYLGKHGAGVDVQMSPLGLTPVHRAIFLKRRNVVSVLITKFKAKVSLPCVDIPASYPVYNAVYVADYNILETVLKAGDADPNVPEPSEHVTALHFAAYIGDLMAAECLFSHGANVNAQLKCGHSPLDLAIQEKMPRVAGFLKRCGGQRKVFDKSWHPFICCVMEDLQSLKTAVNRGMDINVLLSPTIGAALHYVIAKGEMSACKFLIRKGADLERRCVLGKTPLHIAAEHGLINFIEFLLGKGANINAQTNSGFTSLHSAVMRGNVATCKFLISKGADLEVKSRQLGPPLSFAVLNHHTSIVQLLLKAGANPNARTPETAVRQMNILQLAVEYTPSKPKIIKALIKAGADVKAPVITQPLAGANGTASYLHILPMVTNNVESMKLLIEAGAYLDSQAMLLDFHVPENYGGSPLQSTKKGGSPVLVQLLENTINLFKAVRKDDLALAEKYLAQGGLVNCCSFRYDTPLNYASWKGFAKMVKFLLSSGAKIVPNLEKPSPLHYAARYNQKEVAIELLKGGAPIDLIRSNKTPLELAQKHNHPDTVAILIFTKKYLAESRTNKLSPIADWKNSPNITRLASEFSENISEKDLEALFGL